MQVPLYIEYYSVSLGWFLYTGSTVHRILSVSLGWSLYTGSTVHLLLQCVPWVVFICRFHCTSTTTVCPLGGLYMQVPLYINYYGVSLRRSLYTGSTVHQLLQCVPWVVFIYRFHCTSTTTVCPLGGLYMQVPLYIYYYSVSLGWSLYTGSTVHQLLQCVPWVVFIYRFHCTSTTTVCPLGGLYIQVPLYINYYGVSLGWSLYTGSTVHQLLQCVPWVVFIYRFHCTSTTTVCPLGGLYIQVPLYINYYSVSFGWSFIQVQ